LNHDSHSAFVGDAMACPFSSLDPGTLPLLWYLHEPNPVFTPAALSIAISTGRTPIVKILIQDSATAHVNLNDNLCYNVATATSMPPLHFAVKAGQPEVVSVLLSNTQIDPNATVREAKSRTALMLAVSEGHVPVVQTLLSLNVVRTTVQHRTIDVNAKDSDGRTALHIAARLNQVAVAKALLADARVNLNAQGNDGNSPLLIAAREGHVEVVRELLSKRSVEVHLMNANMWTALMAASVRGHSEVVKVLLRDPRVKINFSNDKGGRHSCTRPRVVISKWRRSSCKILVSASIFRQRRVGLH